MRKYKVIITPVAKADMRDYLAYLRHEKKNPQAVRAVLDDFKATVRSLGENADHFAEPNSEKLKAMGLKRLNFIKGHRYFVLFKIEIDDIVYITNVFHRLEDFESKLH